MLIWYPSSIILSMFSLKEVAQTTLDAVGSEITGTQLFHVSVRLPCDQVKAVVVGYDKHFSFSKAIKACSYAKNPNNIFIGTNMDASLPIENKEIVIPGTYVREVHGYIRPLGPYVYLAFLYTR